MPHSVATRRRCAAPDVNIHPLWSARVHGGATGVGVNCPYPTGAPCVEWSPDRKTEDPETWREERDGPSEIGIRQVDDRRPAFDITSARGAARCGARLGDGDRRIRAG